MNFTNKLFLGIIGFVCIIVFIGAFRGHAPWAVVAISTSLFAWLLFKQRRNTHASLQFSQQWKDLLSKKVIFYQELSVSEKLEFEKRILSFFSEIRITGVDFEIDDECRLLVASSSIIPFWDLPLWNYGELQEVLVYSNHFDENYQVGEDEHILGMVGSGAHMNHVMLLSKPALYTGFENKTNKNHVGFHEFAHLLDKSDGQVDGIPELLLPKEMANPWTKLVHREIKNIRTNHSDINPYGGTSEAEFFAVISEYYHKQPKLLAKKHPDLSKMLEMIYHPNGRRQ